MSCKYLELKADIIKIKILFSVPKVSIYIKLFVNLWYLAMNCYLAPVFLQERTHKSTYGQLWKIIQIMLYSKRNKNLLKLKKLIVFKIVLKIINLC